jgi:hypothetical protein
MPPKGLALDDMGQVRQRASHRSLALEPIFFLRYSSFTATFGCNTMRRGIEAGDQARTLCAAASSMMARPYSQGAWNRSLDEKLRATKSSAFVGDTLLLVDEAGETAGTFRAV